MRPAVTPHHARGPFQLARGEDLTPLARVLERHGYVGATLARLADLEVLGGRSEVDLDVAAILRRTAAPSPLNTLVRLFLLARSVSEEAARQALAPVDPDRLLAIGLLTRDVSGVRAEVALVPFVDLFVCRDFWPHVSGRPTSTDYVLGVGSATLALANLTVRRQGERMLDLGTGSGVHALLAARHAAAMIGTDVNPRALGMAALNASLNGLNNVEWRLGSLYDPVADDRFDLIVSNPPFVISPRSDYLYRDSSMPGDTVCERVIRGAPRQLREGGFCSVLFNWHHADADDWSHRPQSWIAGSGCDGWLLCSNTEDPIRYASRWLREERKAGEKNYHRVLEEWLAYYERMDIRWISSGMLVLRRRSGTENWFRAEPAPPGHPSGSCSDQIQRIFAAEDLLQDLGDGEKLLDRPFVLSEAHEVQQTLHAEHGRWIVREALLRQTDGFSFTGETDPLLSRILVGCDGKHTIRDLAAGLADELRADPAQIGSAAAGVVRKLLRSGFLVLPVEK